MLVTCGLDIVGYHGSNELYGIYCKNGRYIALSNSHGRYLINVTHSEHLEEEHEEVRAGRVRQRAVSY